MVGVDGIVWAGQSVDGSGFSMLGRGLRWPRLFGAPKVQSTYMVECRVATVGTASMLVGK